MKKLFKFFEMTKRRISSFLRRRPHRSFRPTKKRDYKRSLELPGYIAFTKYVWNVLWKNKKVFISLALKYCVITIFMVGAVSQDYYSQMSEILKGTGGDAFSDGMGKIGGAGLLFLAALSGGFQELDNVQQIYAGLIILMTWLATVWLLRNILAGNKVKMRDGLYNSGSPIISTLLVALLLLVQLLPIAITLIAYVAAISTGLLNGGVEAMLFWFMALLLVTLSLYWMTGTLFALVIVSLPGMYPFKAIKAAGDMVVGRRFRILLRLIWMLLCTVVVWAVIMIPVIIIDSWIKSAWPIINWIPIVPLLILVMSSLSVVWISSYVYLFYRKVVADDSAPAL